ncbi:cullin-1-like isoform X2 [Abrus precatorius]|nr:cullin-1-like isoform X2 [Abrus precatorius]
MTSSMEECKKTSMSFEEVWPLLQIAVNKLINQIEGVDNSSFTSQEYMSYYTTVYEFCTDRLGDENSKLLYAQYKKVFEEYINSMVLPSLRGKKNEILLRELLRRWSNHKIMTRWLLRFFHFLERYHIPRWKLPSLEEISFLTFHDLVYDEMNNQVVVSILYMIDQERAGEQIDRTLVNNVLAIYSEMGNIPRENNTEHFAVRMTKDNAALYEEASNWIASSSFKNDTPKEEKLNDNPIPSSKKINLISSNGDVFEVDYALALMSKTIKDVIETHPTDDTDSISIPVSRVSSKMLAMVIEYCKKHTEVSNSNYDEHISNIDINDWDAEFLDVNHQAIFDLILASNYFNIKSLLDLTTNKIGDIMKCKTAEEIRNIFNIKHDFTPEEHDI